RIACVPDAVEVCVFLPWIGHGPTVVYRVPNPVAVRVEPGREWPSGRVEHDPSEQGSTGALAMLFELHRETLHLAPRSEDGFEDVEGPGEEAAARTSPADVEAGFRRLIVRRGAFVSARHQGFLVWGTELERPAVLASVLDGYAVADVPCGGKRTVCKCERLH